MALRTTTYTALTLERIAGGEDFRTGSVSLRLGRKGARAGSTTPVVEFPLQVQTNPLTHPRNGRGHEVNEMVMFEVTTVYSDTGRPVVRTRCPACRQRALFDHLGAADLHFNMRHGPKLVAGQRRCPDPDCHTHLFFIQAGGKLLVTYPPETIDFDSAELPSGVLGALEEAVICHANGAFFAAAIMVRKTLEEVCRDKEASGQNLKKKLEALRGSVILPPQFFDGLDDLRLLGNDAAHVKSRTYETVGREEVEIALEFTKEVLKAVYQYSTLTDRLRSLKTSD